MAEETSNSTEYATSGASSQSAGIKESDGTAYQAPGNGILVGRKHDGDENGTTYYWYADFNYNGVPITLTDRQWSKSMKESGSEFECPANTVMTGRKHSGDENGQTEYEYATPVCAGYTITVFTPSYWSKSQKESGSSFECPANYFLVGRKHTGDENGQTQYAYSQMIVSKA